MMPLGKMSGGFLSPTPIFVLEDKDSLSGQALNACMQHMHDRGALNVGADEGTD
jgi:hypothetical protein